MILILPAPRPCSTPPSSCTPHRQRLCWKRICKGVHDVVSSVTAIIAELRPRPVALTLFAVEKRSDSQDHPLGRTVAHRLRATPTSTWTSISGSDRVLAAFAQAVPETGENTHGVESRESLTRT
eukprot:1055045-Rhodomonas_salina.1